MTDHVYEIWRIQHVPFIEGVTPGHSFMARTNGTITARSDKEADYKLRRKFKNAGFHSMSLVARRVEEGRT